LGFNDEFKWIFDFSEVVESFPPDQTLQSPVRVVFKQWGLNPNPPRLMSYK